MQETEAFSTIGKNFSDRQQALRDYAATREELREQERAYRLMSYNLGSLSGDYDVSAEREKEFVEIIDQIKPIGTLRALAARREELRSQIADLDLKLKAATGSA